MRKKIGVRKKFFQLLLDVIVEKEKKRLIRLLLDKKS